MVELTLKYLRRRPYRLRPGSWRWLVALSVLTVLVSVPELTLRLVEFRYESRIEYGGLRPEYTTYFVPDGDLLWKYPASEPDINSLGFRGSEVAVPKESGVKRLLFLGDSCTDQDFARLVEAALNMSDADSVRYECILLAVPGYSSYQGKVLAQKYAGLLQADLAFVLFGWNDHWLAYGCTDEATGAASFRKVCGQLYHHYRVLQACVKLVHSIFGCNEQQVLDEVRVPAQQYRDNLEVIDSTFGHYSVPVVFITAPTSHYAAGVPDRLLEDRLAPDAGFVIGKHREYCDIVREVARTRDAYLLDLERQFSSYEYPAKLFMSDGVHFSKLGLEVVASSVFRFVKDEMDWR